MSNLRNIQFLRSQQVYNTLALAKAALSAQATNLLDGSPIIGRYLYGTGETQEVKSLIGIAHKGVNSENGVTFFESANDIADAIAKLQAEMDATQAAVGLNENGGKIDQTDSKFISGKTTVELEIKALNDVLAALNADTVSGESKVVIDVTQEDGQITATSANLTGVKLAGLTAGTDTKITATNTLGEALANIQGQIDAMDKAASAVDGQVVTTVTEVDGKVTETKANVKDLQLGGYSKDTTANGDIASGDTINVALSKLENKAAAITIGNADKTINVTTSATGTDINVNIKSGEHVLAKDGNAGLYTDIDLVKITTGLPETVKERYQLLATDDNQIGVNIDVPKDSHIVSINYITTGEHAQNLEYVYINDSGETQTTYVDMSELVLETEFGSGVTVTNHVAHGVVDSTSETFLTVGADGFKLAGVQDAIDDAIEALDVTDDAAVAGQYVAAIEETDGVVAVKTRANVSEAVLNNYAKGSDSTAVAATDTVNQAVSKLENQIDKAKAAATTKVVEGTDAGNNLSISSAVSETDESVTYTVNLTDVASNNALDAEVTRAKDAEAAIDSVLGSTKASGSETRSWDESGNVYATGGSANADIKKLDSAVNELSGKTVTSITSNNGSITATISDSLGNKTYNIETDASKISGLTAYTADSSVRDIVSGVSASDKVSTGIDKLYKSLAAEVAARKAAITQATIKSGNGGIVVDSQSSGTTVTLTLDKTTNGTGGEKTGADNALTITNSGLFLSNTWDCGIFNEEPQP